MNFILHQSEWLRLKIQEIAGVGEGVEKEENIWYANCVLSIQSFWANIHLSVIAFHVYSFVIGLPHLEW